MQDQDNVAGGFRVPGNDLEIAWAAGLFEGEGTIHFKPQGKRGSGCQLRLGMNDKDVVVRFREIIGCGGLYAHKPGTGSTVPCWTWYVYNARKVEAILNVLLPHFGARRGAKALEALAVVSTIRSYAERTHCPRGHPYSGENLVIETTTRNGKLYERRRCRICRNDASRDRARKRLGTQPENFRV